MNSRQESNSNEPNSNPFHPDQTLPPEDQGLLFDDATEPNADVSELTAYLDGELESTQIFEIENRLNADPQFLNEMQSLQKAWDLLEHLPLAGGNNEFVKTTMELIVADAVQEQRQSQRNWRKVWLGVIYILIPLGLIALSYNLVRSRQMQPHQLLIDNFEVIQNLERYQRLNGNLDFLVKLDQLELFADDIAASYRQTTPPTFSEISSAGEDGDTNAAVDPWQAAGRQYAIDEIQELIDQMESQKVSLLRLNYEKFLQLSPDEAQALSELHRNLNQRSDSDRLKKVMNSYYDWLIRLGTSETHGGMATVAEILDLPVDERLQRIYRIRSDQIREAFGRWGATRLPNDEDVEVLLNWFDLSINTNQQQIREQFTTTVPEFLQRQNANANISREALARFARRQSIRQIVAALFRIDRTIVENIIFQDIQLLLNGLSLEAQTILLEYEPEEQKELVMNWIDAAIQAKSTIPEDKLQEFYESLPARKRDELDQLSIEDWNATLTQMFWEQNRDSRLFREWENQIFGGGLFPFP
jgi:hypothetical protein